MLSPCQFQPNTPLHQRQHFLVMVGSPPLSTPLKRPLLSFIPSPATFMVLDATEVPRSSTQYYTRTEPLHPHIAEDNKHYSRPIRSLGTTRRGYSAMASSQASPTASRFLPRIHTNASTAIRSTLPCAFNTCSKEPRTPLMLRFRTIF